MVDFSTLLAAVDFSLVIAAIVAITGILFSVYGVLVSVNTILGLIRGANRKESQKSYGWDVFDDDGKFRR